MQKVNTTSRREPTFDQQLAMLFQLWSSLPNEQVAIRGEEEAVLPAQPAGEETERQPAEDIYPLMAEHSLQGLAVVQDFEIIYANLILSQITGYSLEEMRLFTAEIIKAAVFSDNQHEAWQRLVRYLAEGTLPPRLELCFPHKDGAMRWAETYASSVEYRQKPTILITCIDITERKQAELELQQMYAKLELRVRERAEELATANGILQAEIMERRQAERALQQAHDELEQRVQERTEELAGLNQALQSEIAERKQIEIALRNSEELFRSLIENASDIITILGADGAIHFESPSIERLLDYKPDELEGRNAFDFVHPDDREDVVSIVREAIAEPGVTRSAVFRFRHKDGSWRILESLGKYLQEDQVVSGMVVNSRDITKRKEAEQKIQLLGTISSQISEAEDFHQALQITLTRVCEAIQWDMGEAWTLSAEETFLECSPAWYCEQDQLLSYRQKSKKLTFFPSEGLPGRVWERKQPSWIQDIGQTSRAPASHAQIAGEAGLQAVLGVPIVADRRLLAVLIFYRLSPCPEDRQLIDLVTTVAAQLGSLLLRKQVEEEKTRLLEQVKQQREQLRVLAMRRRRLANQIINAQEEERRRVSRELHDEAGQALTAMKVGLEMIYNDLAAAGDAETSGYQLMQQRLQQAIFLSEETSTQIRTLAHKLRPAALDDLGLNLALEGLCHDFAAWANLAISYKGADVHLLNGAEISLYRFLQEGLTNVARHADASQVWVTLSIQDDQAYLSVADNGQGFDVTMANGANGGAQGIGLLGIEERLSLFGGKLDIDSGINRGTRLTAVIPFQEQA